MSLGAPWVRDPDWWSLEGIPLRVQIPAITSLVRPLLLPDHKAGLWTCIELTAPADRRLIVDAIVTDRTLVSTLDTAADVLIEKIVGWKRWEAAHLWDRTLKSWAVIDGDLTAAGVDVTALPPARATNAVFSWWRKNLGRDETEWKRFLRELQREPRRILEREAEKPMDVTAFGALPGLAKKKPTEPVPTSTITMP